MSVEFVSRRNFVKFGSVAAATFAMGGLLSSCASSEQGGASNSSNTQSQQSGASDAQSQQSETAPQQAPDPNKILVAYYSGQGHTRAVAKVAADELGADLFEIVPTQVYSEDDLNWRNSDSRVSVEHDNQNRRDVPLQQTTPDNWGEYGTVLVGYPIWWGEAAWPMNHFASDNDFSGKKVFPFCTSSSSGAGQSGQFLANTAGTGEWQASQRFSSSASEDEVRAWAKSL